MPSNQTRPLTPRELVVFQRFADGHSYKQIASELGISSKTVNCHLVSIRRKVGVKPMALLARKAVQLGIVPPAPGVMIDKAEAIRAVGALRYPGEVLDSSVYMEGYDNAISAALNGLRALPDREEVCVGEGYLGDEGLAAVLRTIAAQFAEHDLSTFNRESGRVIGRRVSLVIRPRGGEEG